jgi:hypothetical protein
MLNLSPQETQQTEASMAEELSYKITETVRNHNCVGLKSKEPLRATRIYGTILMEASGAVTHRDISWTSNARKMPVEDARKFFAAGLEMCDAVERELAAITGGPLTCHLL